MIRKLLLVFPLLIISTFCLCQYPLNYFKITSSNTSFPDTGRVSGHFYNKILYNKQDHYSDSEVLIITPTNFNASKHADMIFWFHGWNNNIDSALVRYGLSRQFAVSGLNAVLVLAETAKDAPDSYAGKLEQPGRFEGLVDDVLHTLKQEKIIRTTCTAGHIILAGHSGAYRVMANIITDGNVPVDEVILFDALYADTDKFLNWLTAKSDRRFIDLYTDNGGTFDETKAMMKQLTNLRIQVDSLEEPAVNPGILQKNKIVFIHTLHRITTSSSSLITLSYLLITILF